VDALTPRCTVCSMRGRNVPATHVAGAISSDPSRHIQWFECSAHNANDNHLDVVRTYHATLGEWMATIERICKQIIIEKA
jgi:hypothetical protein